MTEEVLTGSDPATKQRQLWSLRAACFLQVFMLGGLIAFQTVWMREHGLGEFLIGIVQGTATAVLLLSGLVWGMLADRTGKANRIATIGSVAVGGALLVLFFARTPVHFFAFALVHGISFPMVWNLMPLLAVSVVAGGTAGRGYGSYRIFGSMGFVAATLILPRLVPDIGSVLLICAAAIALAALPLLAGNVRLPRNHARGNLKALLRNRDLAVLFAATFFFSLANPAIWSFQQVYARRLGADTQFIGLLVSINGLLGMASLLPCGWAVDRFGPRWLLLLAFLTQPIRVALMAMVGRYEWLLAPQVLQVFTWAGFEIAVMLFITQVVAEGGRATAIAAYVGVRTLGWMLSAPVAGYLAENYSYPLMFAVSAVAAAVGFVIFIAPMLRNVRSTSPAPADTN